MNRTIYFLTALIISFAVESCTDDIVVSPGRDFRISGSISAADTPQSRVSLEYNSLGANCQWESGDTIGLISADGSIDNIPCVADYDGVQTTFRIADGYTAEWKDGDTIYAYYPYRKGCNEGTVVNLSERNESYTGYVWYTVGTGRLVSALQDRMDGFRDFVMASGTVKGNALDFEFRHLFSFVRVRLGNELCLSDDKRNRYIDIGFYNTSTAQVKSPLTLDLSTGEIDEGEVSTYLRAYMDSVEDNIRNGEDLVMYASFPAQTISRKYNYFTVTLPGHTLYMNLPDDGFRPGVLYDYSVGQDELDSLLEREYKALMALYEQCGGKDWFDGQCNWNREVPLTDWNGVYTEIPDPYNWPDRTAKFVTDLRLENFNGSIPEEIADLTFLKEFVLPESGWIQTSSIKELPKSLREMKNLKNFSIPRCGAIGCLTDYFPVIQAGMRIIANDNRFSGPVPDLDPDFVNVSLENNNLTGSIPSSWTTFLDKLMPREGGWPYLADGIPYNVLAKNRLSGQIPVEIQRHPRFNWLMTSLIQQDGYGFDPVRVKWATDRFILADGTIFDLGESYSHHKYTVIVNVMPSWGVSSAFWQDLNRLYRTYRDRGMQMIITSQQPIWPNISVCDVNGPQFDVSRSIMDDDVVYIDPYSYEGSMWSGSNHPEMAFTTSPSVGLPTIHEYYPYVISVIDNQGYYVGSYQIQCPLEAKYNQFPLYLQENLYNYIAGLFGDDSYNPDNVPYTSTDYSEDGKVVTLQRATRGSGIDIVLLGSGFVDLDMDEDGAYECMMKEMCDAIFKYEPYTSLRDRFNVYAVKAVSANREFGGSSKHVFDSDDGSSCVDVDKIFDYATKAPVKGEPLVAVIYNTVYDEKLARSYTAMFEDNSAIALVFENDMSVFVHEMCGHAIGKLADEYVEFTEIDDYHTAMLAEAQSRGWFLNVDVTGDPKKVRWAHFLADSRYAAEELGCYEGGYNYVYGVWRPSMNSMMRYNDCGFNAPSREIIYKRIMELSEGPEWSYDYETFYEFDRGNIVKNGRRRTANRKDTPSYSKAPVFVKGTWRNHGSVDL